MDLDNACASPWKSLASIQYVEIGVTVVLCAVAVATTCPVHLFFTVFRRADFRIITETNADDLPSLPSHSRHATLCVRICVHVQINLHKNQKCRKSDSRVPPLFVSLPVIPTVIARFFCTLLYLTRHGSTVNWEGRMNPKHVHS